MRIKCKDCGQIHNSKDPCKQGVPFEALAESKPRKPAKKKIEWTQKQDPDSWNVEGEGSAPAKGHAPLGPGQQIQIRLQAELLQRLDKARGGMTRPAKIREILEEHL